MTRPVALLSLLLVVGACGGSTETSSSTGGTGGAGGSTGGAGGNVGGSGGTAAGGSGGTGATDGGSGGMGATDGGSGGTSGTGGGTTKNSGDCDSDADCSGGACVELSPGGYRVCKMPVTEATSCSDPQFDQCCNSSECTQGKCYDWPPTPYCG